MTHSCTLSSCPAPTFSFGKQYWHPGEMLCSWRHGEQSCSRFSPIVISYLFSVHGHKPFSLCPHLPPVSSSISNPPYTAVLCQVLGVCCCKTLCKWGSAHSLVPRPRGLGTRLGCRVYQYGYTVTIFTAAITIIIITPVSGIVHIATIVA